MKRTANPLILLPALLLWPALPAGAQAVTVTASLPQIETQSAVLPDKLEEIPVTFEDVADSQGNCAIVGREGCPGSGSSVASSSEETSSPAPAASSDDDGALGLNTVRPSLGGRYGDKGSSEENDSDAPAALGGAESVGGLFAGLSSAGAGGSGAQAARPAGPAPSANGLVQNFRGFSTGGSSYINGTDPGKMTAAAASMLKALNGEVQQTNRQQAADVRPAPDRAVAGQ